jgi:hypothetical protein
MAGVEEVVVITGTELDQSSQCLLLSTTGVVVEVMIGTEEVVDGFQSLQTVVSVSGIGMEEALVMIGTLDVVQGVDSAPQSPHEPEPPPGGPGLPPLGGPWLPPCCQSPQCPPPCPPCPP